MKIAQSKGGVRTPQPPPRASGSCEERGSVCPCAASGTRDRVQGAPGAWRTRSAVGGGTEGLAWAWRGREGQTQEPPQDPDLLKVREPWRQLTPDRPPPPPARSRSVCARQGRHRPLCRGEPGSEGRSPGPRHTQEAEGQVREVRPRLRGDLPSMRSSSQRPSRPCPSSPRAGPLGEGPPWTLGVTPGAAGRGQGGSVWEAHTGAQEVYFTANFYTFV